MSTNITIIGAGIIGLTTALTLQTHLPPTTTLTILARDLPGTESPNYSSPWAGAHYRPNPINTAQKKLEATWCSKTYHILKSQAISSPEAGIKFLPGYEYFEKPGKDYLSDFASSNGVFNGLEGFRRLEKEEVPAGVEMGVRYETWCLNSPVYCQWLIRRFILNGGKVVKYTLSNLLETFHITPNTSLLINCSGYGFSDPKICITRGQTCLVRNPCDRTITQQNRDGTWTFLIPRPLDGGTVVGGTKEVGDWNPFVDEGMRGRLLERAGKMFPGVLDGDGGWDVIRDIVGRRPTREGGMRLEVEGVGEGRWVVHAYGAGGSGYEFSWGVAEEVVKMVDGVLGVSGKSRL